MPNLYTPIRPDDLNSVVRQINQVLAKLDAEVTRKVFNDENGNRLVLGTIDGRVGVLLYDTAGNCRAAMTLAPDDGRPGLWITKEGYDVFTELAA